jgi:peptidase A4-like protein
MVRRVLACIVACAFTCAVAGFVDSAAAGTQSRLTLVSTRGARTHSLGRSQSRLRARLGVSPDTLTYLGGKVTLTVSSSHAVRCVLSARPALWSGGPIRVRCHARYNLTLRAAAIAHHWTLTLTARSRSGRLTRSHRTLALEGTPFQTSPNWSGYSAISNAPVTEVSGHFTVPTLDCARTPKSTETTWVGIGGDTRADGSSTGALLQTGVDSDCVDSSQVSNPAWWELIPPYDPVFFNGMSISPGDQIEASVHQLSDGSWFTRTDDLTTGVSGIMQTGRAWGTIRDSSPSVWLSYQGDASSVSYAGGFSAEWIVEDFDPPLVDFGSIQFTQLTSSPGGILTNQDAIDLEDKTGNWLLDVPSGLSGNSFSVTYLASS